MDQIKTLQVRIDKLEADHRHQNEQIQQRAHDISQLSKALLSYQDNSGILQIENEAEAKYIKTLEQHVNTLKAENPESKPKDSLNREFDVRSTRPITKFNVACTHKMKCQLREGRNAGNGNPDDYFCESTDTVCDPNVVFG